MRQRKNRIIVILVIYLAIFTVSCGQNNNVDNNTEENEETIIGTDFIVNETTKIQDDFEYFNMELTESYDTLALAKICSIINDNNTFFVYLNMPMDTETAQYRVRSLEINNITYTPKLIEVDGYYQKYVMYYCDLAPDQKYTVTEIEYYNNLDLADSYTHYQNQVCYLKTDDGIYTFQIEYQNEVLLQGRLMECVYQFNKRNNGFFDLWYKVTDNCEMLDGDKRSFFYFAFNCYDRERGISFTPEDILQVDISYNELCYRYKGKDKTGIGKVKPEVTAKEEAVVPDNVTVTAKDSKRGNGFYYDYQTINRLDQADFEQNVSEDKNAVLEMAAKNYDWAISVGNRSGYRYAANDTLFSHDYEFTEIEDFRTIHIIYVMEGHTYSVDTDSLIGNKIVSLPDVVPEEPGMLESLKKHVVSVVVGIAVIVVIIAAVRITCKKIIKFIRHRKKDLGGREE